jgi:hypothetical protein
MSAGRRSTLSSQAVHKMDSRSWCSASIYACDASCPTLRKGAQGSA